MNHIIIGIILSVIGVIGIIVIRQISKRRISNIARGITIVYTAILLAMGLTYLVYDTKFMLVTPWYIESLYGMSDNIINKWSKLK